MYYTIYKITNKINGKIYIGVHKTSDINDEYMGSGKILKYAIEKYGVDNFTKEYIDIFDNPEDMFEMESKLVNEDFIKRRDTYNIKLGGCGGWDYVNDKMPGYGYKFINENGLNNKANQCYISANRIKDSDEYKKWFGKRVSEGLKGRNIKTFLGRKHTEKTKRKIGEANSKHQKGKGNSQYGTMWIHNLELKESKKIKKEDLSEWIDKGWLKGRKMKFY